MTHTLASTKHVVTVLAVLLLTAVPAFGALGALGSPAALSHSAPSAAPTVPADRTQGSAASPNAVVNANPQLPAVASLSARAALPLGEFPVVRSGPGARTASGAVALPYSTAATDVLVAAAGFDSESWAVTFGAGISLSVAETLSTSTLGGAPLGCTISWIGAQPPTLTFPATPGSAVAGTATTYEFVLYSPAAPQFDLIADVVDASATLLYTESSACSPDGGSPTGAAPSNPATLDSPAAVSIANRAGGSAFLQLHPTAVQEWVLEPGAYALTDDSIVITNPPYWIVEDVASCGQFVAELDALTGAVLGNSTSATCSPSYNVTFEESGLPGGTQWSVSLESSTNSSTSTQVGFSENNGSYTYTVGAVDGFAPTLASGTVDVVGTDANVSVTFTAASTYGVTFQESGLPTGTYWSVELGGLSFVSNTTTIPFSELNGSQRYNVAFFAGWTASPTTGKAKVVGAPLTVPIAFTAILQYAVEVNESGLPVGTLWGVLLDGGSTYLENFSASATVGFEVPNGTFFLQAGSGSAYYNTSALGDMVVVAGASASATFNFTGRAAYPVAFDETGLPGGTGWEVTVNSGVYEINSSAGASIGFVLPNGTYGFVPGGAAGYNVTPVNGTLVVNGSGADVTINFTGPAVVAPMYAVTFTESGLPTGTQWSVTLLGVANSSVGISVGFSETNGSDGFTVAVVVGYQASPSSGNVVVSGAPVNEGIVFTPLSTTPTYAVTFTEAGLASGISWTVTFAGTSTPSTSTTDAFTAANGSFAFSVAAVTGYTASPSSGSVLIQGGPAGQAITFTAVAPTVTKYAVTFTESGLTSGTTWSVTYGGSTSTSTTDSIAFSEANGSYTFSVGAVTGYSASPSTGSLAVSGAPASQSIQFTASSGQTTPPTSSPNTFLGLPADEGYGLVIAIVLVVLVIAGLVAWRMRKNSGGATPPLDAPPATPPSP
jgi:hypothetical protein